MRDVSVGFLWHMHQPYYKDPVSGTYSMPWVRLHAVKGYYDMVAVLEDFPQIRCTFNLVPSLLTQLIDYTENGLRDSDYLISAKPASDLSQDEKEQIIGRFFRCNRQTMIDPFPRYVTLLGKKGRFLNRSDIDTAVKSFSTQDLLDLQVLFNLTWLGFMARKDETIHELIRKGRAYTETDKAYILAKHIEIMENLLPLYKKAREEGRIEITTTPFYHPIAPLLMNVGYALRCMDIPLPEEPFAHPEDLELQVEKAVSLHEQVFGAPPDGMWPAEGSVCPEMIDIINRHGIKWIATDEDILFASLQQSRTGYRLHRPYWARQGDNQVGIFFRDRALADNIGFVYSRNPAGSAVNDLIHHINNIRKGARAYDFEPFVSVILDGENPWEYYNDGGEAFLRGIYGAIAADPGIKTETFGGFLRNNPPQETIAKLYTGSWINHNFAIWIGHEEDRKAWEYLAKTRKYVEEKGPRANPLAWEEIYIAEGSDWCWWYGDEFNNENIHDFDRLFRRHLKNCYELHGDQPPDYLSRSIITPHDISPLRQPAGFSVPVIDGRLTHFYEWRKSGVYVTTTGASSMYKQESVIGHIYYGFDSQNLFLRLDFNQPPEEGSRARINIVSPEEIAFTIDIHKGTVTRADNPAADTSDCESAFETILECRIPFSYLKAQPMQRVRFAISLHTKDIEQERHPAAGLLSFTVPDQEFERMMWYV